MNFQYIGKNYQCIYKYLQNMNPQNRTKSYSAYNSSSLTKVNPSTASNLQNPQPQYHHLGSHQTRTHSKSQYKNNQIHRTFQNNNAAKFHIKFTYSNPTSYSNYSNPINPINTTSYTNYPTNTNYNAYQFKSQIPAKNQIQYHISKLKSQIPVIENTQSKVKPLVPQNPAKIQNQQKSLNSATQVKKNLQFKQVQTKILSDTGMRVKAGSNMMAMKGPGGYTTGVDERQD